MAECASETCSNPAEQTICGQCVSDLQAWLDKVPDMMEELFITMARLDATAPRNREGGDGMTTEATMPIRVGALEVRAALRLWVEVKTNGRMVALKASELANDRFAAGFLPMLEKLLARAERAIDNPMEKHVYGNCSALPSDADGEEYECGQELQAAPDAPEMECPNCGTWYDLQALRNERKTYFRETPMPPREARETLEAQTGVKLNKKTFENWVARRALRYVLDRIGFGTDEKRLYFPIDLLGAHQKIRE